MDAKVKRDNYIMNYVLSKNKVIQSDKWHTLSAKLGAKSSPGGM